MTHCILRGVAAKQALKSKIGTLMVACLLFHKKIMLLKIDGFTAVNTRRVMLGLKFTLCSNLKRDFYKIMSH